MKLSFLQVDFRTVSSYRDQVSRLAYENTDTLLPSLAEDRKKLNCRTPPGKRDGQQARCAYGRRSMLEADLQDLTFIAHEPSSFWIRKSHGPEAAHSRQVKPSAAFIWSPGRFS